MASIYKRKDGKGWRAVVRIQGYPTVCDHFERKEEAKDWALDLERQIKAGQYKFNQQYENSYYNFVLGCFVNRV